MALLPSPEEIETALKTGERVAALWKRISDYFRRKRTYALFSGMEGVGKTVLLDYLTGRAYERGYEPPDTSKRAERGTTTSAKWPVGLVVVPGQFSRPRMEAVEGTLLGKRPPVGVVHVVANGFASVRGHEASDTIAKTAKLKTVAEWQKSQRKREIEELEQVCGWIRQAHRNRRQPAWLILTVTKYDLFPDATADLHDDYFPGGRGEVVKLLDELTRRVGSDNFRWQATTACGFLSDQLVAKAEVKSRLSPQQRDVLVEELGKLIGGFCYDERE